MVISFFFLNYSCFNVYIDVYYWQRKMMKNYILFREFYSSLIVLWCIILFRINELKFGEEKKWWMYKYIYTSRRWEEVGCWRLGNSVKSENKFTLLQVLVVMLEVLLSTYRQIFYFSVYLLIRTWQFFWMCLYKYIYVCVNVGGKIVHYIFLHLFMLNMQKEMQKKKKTNYTWRDLIFVSSFDIFFFSNILFRTN